MIQYICSRGLQTSTGFVPRQLQLQIRPDEESQCLKKFQQANNH